MLSQTSGKAYAPEFYYDTYNPLWQNRARIYTYSLEWTQMNPEAVDRILTYHLGIRQGWKLLRQAKSLRSRRRVYL
ncbi:UNVERIFIED_CONTAM: MAM domain-containing glycosylphosphatidylinositol anchor protein 2 [Gekko kuhli]